MEADNIYSDSYGENKMSDCLIVMEDVLLLAFQQLLQNLNINVWIFHTNFSEKSIWKSISDKKIFSMFSHVSYNNIAF